MCCGCMWVYVYVALWVRASATGSALPGQRALERTSPFTAPTSLDKLNRRSSNQFLSFVSLLLIAASHFFPISHSPCIFFSDNSRTAAI